MTYPDVGKGGSGRSGHAFIYVFRVRLNRCTPYGDLNSTLVGRRANKREHRAAGGLLVYEGQCRSTLGCWLVASLAALKHRSGGDIVYFLFIGCVVLGRDVNFLQWLV